MRVMKVGVMENWLKEFVIDFLCFSQARSLSGGENGARERGERREKKSYGTKRER